MTTFTPSPERKHAPAAEFKADNAGQFRAVFATFDRVDRDGDVTRRSAFRDGAEVVIGSYGHTPSELPVGKGVIKTTPTEARVEGAFFLDTTPGRETYQTIKNAGELQQWSYVFRVRKSRRGDYGGERVRFLEDVEVFSVDPVLKGAGETRTVEIKCADCAAKTGELCDEEKAALREIGELNATRESVREARSTLNRVSPPCAPAKLDPYPEVAEMWISWQVKQAATDGAVTAAAHLGIPTPPVRWFTQAKGAAERYGYASPGAPIRLRSDLSPEVAHSVAMHEAAHVAGIRDEAKCDDIADRLAGRPILRNIRRQTA